MEISLNKAINNVVKTSEAKALANERVILLKEIEKVKGELQKAYKNFDYVNDSLMVDYYTYQIKAYETMFEFLIKKAKAMGISEL
ncbi:DUF2508 family protein [Ruminiclostridium cellulolyticum]|uniref:Uncharacterized protein n=1 Tax=Ruminiclostridium cellulolyticum (strain ATCC 35319 / DSM 5812 / JCM 6584 / H10) TaxID=394503 RepID=B8I3S5_RUMCH|nr:DUF2508 family protein [Ruminiclostridium cellulolyticum]ACL74402.1 hypothetical protein Ccel_0014 [Ruminiclostridium cellulolyticum H10]